MRISQIAAMTENRVIGVNNALPWKLPADMKFFKDTTTGHVVIMGRKNYEAEGKALKNRVNIVITRKNHYQADGCMVVHSLEQAIEKAKAIEKEEIFIIGGGDIYKQAMKLTDRIYLTVIHTELNGDVFYPELNMAEWQEVSKRYVAKDDANPYDHTYYTYSRLNKTY